MGGKYWCPNVLCGIAAVHKKSKHGQLNFDSESLLFMKKQNIGHQRFHSESWLFMQKQDIGSQALHLGSLSCIKKQNIGGETLHLKSISFMVRAKYLYADVSFGINNFHKAKHR